LASRKLTSGNSCRGLSQQPAQYAWKGREGKGREEKKRGEGKETEPHNYTSRHGRVLMGPTQDVVSASLSTITRATASLLPSFRPLSAEVSGKEEYKSVCR
jgi:hypothetical protein